MFFENLSCCSYQNGKVGRTLLEENKGGSKERRMGTTYLRWQLRFGQVSKFSIDFVEQQRELSSCPGREHRFCRKGAWFVSS